MLNGEPGRGLLGIRVGSPEYPVGGLLGVPLQPGSGLPLWRSEAANPSTDNSRMLALMFPPLPTGGNVNEDIQPARDPLKCSGPNSTCGMPGAKRPNGVFLDPQNPPFKLCRHCFFRSQGRQGTGDDT
jgi:hypothetical protein